MNFEIKIHSRALYILPTAFYGLRRISPRAFGPSLQLAFAYPVLALLLGWLLFDAGTLGGVEFLPHGLGLAWGALHCC